MGTPRQRIQSGLGPCPKGNGRTDGQPHSDQDDDDEDEDWSAFTSLHGQDAAMVTVVGRKSNFPTIPK